MNPIPQVCCPVTAGSPALSIFSGYDEFDPIALACRGVSPNGLPPASVPAVRCVLEEMEDAVGIVAGGNNVFHAFGIGFLLLWFGETDVDDCGVAADVGEFSELGDTLIPAPLPAVKRPLLLWPA